MRTNYPQHREHTAFGPGYSQQPAQGQAAANPPSPDGTGSGQGQGQPQNPARPVDQPQVRPMAPRTPPSQPGDELDIPPFLYPKYKSR
jgi:hypothetical protein